MANKKQADGDPKAAAADQAEEAPYGWDVVGSDGRRIHRNVSLAFATDEKGRIQNQTTEKLSVEPGTAPAWVSATQTEVLETVEGEKVSEEQLAADADNAQKAA